VQGTPDEADVEVTVVERSTGNLLAGVGYSSADGVVFNASISQQNIFGSGNAIIASLNTSKVNRTISLAFTQPYWTVDGVSRTLEIYQRNIDTASLDVTSYTSSTYGGAIGFGVPVTEADTINFGFRIERTNIEFPPGYCDPIPGIGIPPYCLFVAETGTPFNSYIVSGGWSRDTRDDIIYPTKGRLQSFGVEVGLPFGDVPYYKANYFQQWFTPLPYFNDFVLMLRADLGYGDGYAGKPLPFFKAFYAGGVGSVRGYQTGSIGPKDIYGNATGGKEKIVANAELFYPILKGDKSVRVSAFFDAGRISGIPIENTQLSTQLEPGYQDFRYSAGLGLAWNSPVGPLKFSYGIPINPGSLDKIQKFQFQVGSVF
jgi:outer membrane protein insertion porin family